MSTRKKPQKHQNATAWKFDKHRTDPKAKILKNLQVKISCFCISVADPDPGSGAFLTPGSGIRNRFFPDPGSRIPDPKTILLRAF
jgi:hypothetical protein